MKKIIVFVTLVAMGGLWWCWSPQSQEAVVAQTRAGVNSPASSPRIQQLALEVKALNIPATIQSVETAKTKLKKAQKDFKAATEEYNKKAIHQNVTNEDEAKYQVHMKRSHAAYLEYQRIVFNELKLTKEI